MHEALAAFYSTSRPVPTQECGAVVPCTDLQGPVHSRDRAGPEREHRWGVMFEISVVLEAGQGFLPLCFAWFI